LSQCGFPKDDWGKVVALCKDHGFKGMKRAVSPIFQMSPDEFGEWLDKGVGSGDIVNSGDITGIVCDWLKDNIVLSAYTDKDGHFYHKKLILRRYSKADETTAKRFYKYLKTHLLSYNERLGEVVRRFIPRAKEKVAFSNSDGEGLAYIWSVNKTSAHAVYTIVDDLITESVDIPLSETLFYQIDGDGIKRMEETLRKGGFSLDKNTGTLTKSRPRASSGETYWYITDRFTIQTDVEKNRPVNKVRHDRGNYFTDYSEAVDFLMSIMGMRGIK